MKFKFAELSYYPSEISKENVSVAVLIQNLESRDIYFEHVTKYKRIESFDDELNIEFFKLFLKSMKTELDNISKFEFDFTEYIKLYVNSFKFGKVSELSLEQGESEEDFVSKIKKIYLRRDLPKNERLSVNEQKFLIKRILKNSNIDYNSKSINGKYEDSIQFDYNLTDINGKKYGIKIFNFENKEINRMIPNAKTWSYNALKLKENIKIETVFILNDMLCDDNNFKIVYEILNEYSYKCLDLEEGIKFIKSLEPNMRYI